VLEMCSPTVAEINSQSMISSIVVQCVLSSGCYMNVVTSATSHEEV